MVLSRVYDLEEVVLRKIIKQNVQLNVNFYSSSINVVIVERLIRKDIDCIVENLEV